MTLPKPDELAYDGNIVVKSTTYGKSKQTESTMVDVDRVKRAIAMLNKEADKRLTIDCLDLDSNMSLETQVAVNKEVCSELRKTVAMLKTFVANNYRPID